MEEFQELKIRITKYVIEKVKENKFVSVKSITDNFTGEYDLELVYEVLDNCEYDGFFRVNYDKTNKLRGLSIINGIEEPARCFIRENV